MSHSRDKIMDMYCGNHDVVGCTSCMALDHRNCTDVQLIPDIIETIFKTSLVDEAYQKVQEMNSELEKIKTARDLLLEELKKFKTKAITEIKEFRKEMETILKTIEEESIKEVEKHFKQLESTLQDERENADTELKAMKKTSVNLMKSEENKAQQFVSVKDAQRKITLADEIRCSLQPREDAKISFAPDPSIKKYLKQQRNLGSVRNEETVPFKQKTSVYAIKAARELNIKMQNDKKTCYIYGCCLSDDGKLLLADYYNKKLKRVDIAKMSVLDHCNLPGNPYSVCQTCRQEAAVTLNNHVIQFVSLSNQMTPTRQIQLHHKCFGIAYKGDRLYVTDNSDSLYIHDMTGKLLQTVSKNSSGNNLFQGSRHMAFSDTGDKMFVAGGATGLIALDEHRNHSYSFTDAELAWAAAVCTDGRGNILVGGHNSHNVLQIGQDGKKIGVIVKSSDGLNYPPSMCFDKRQCTLIVSLNSSDIVKFFDLH